MNRKCKSCNCELIKRQKMYCSNKCKFNDNDYNKSRNHKIKNDPNYKLVCKQCNWETTDINNLSGALTMHEHSNFDKIKVKKNKKFHCPKCNWETVDLDNKSGCITTHLQKMHNITPIQFIEKYGEFRKSKSKLWKVYFDSITKSNILNKNDNSFVICMECNNRFRRITGTHLKLHGLTAGDYREKYPNESTTADELRTVFSNNAIEMNKKSKFVKISKAEQEIVDYIRKLDIVVEQSDRHILKNGMELDMYLPDFKISIEYNGLKWHSEFFGKKDKNYHLNKTVQCKDAGIQLIHIFEDEWVHNREIVKSRLRNLLRLNENRLYARQCEIRHIEVGESKPFLNEHHIQGTSPSSIKLGAFFKNELISVMTFSKPRISVGQKNKSGEYELVRFASKSNFTIIGIASKLFKHFQRNYTFDTVMSFADLRWSNGNLYEQLGFKLIYKTVPNYWYVDGNKRIHRFNFMKHRLKHLPAYSDNKTEVQIMLESGYDRIWDCGNLKYEFTK